MAETVPSGGLYTGAIAEARDGGIHVRQTLQATGAGELDVGTVIIFTLTGRVAIKDLSIFCTETLVGAATLDFGVVGDTNLLSVQVANASTIGVNEWISVVSGTGILGGVANTLSTFSISGNVVCTIGGANVTDGTIIIDVLHNPITDDGALVAA